MTRLTARLFRCSALAAIALAAACGGDAPPEEAPPPPTPAVPEGDATAPATFRVRFETSKGPVIAEFVRDWSARGVDRFYTLVQAGFYDEARVFRVLPGFVAQFGINADPATNARWRDRTIPDDSVRQTNAAGTISFASRGPNTRTTQLFVNLADNPQLDRMGFSPIGRVVEGLDVIRSFYAEYGENASRNQALIQAEGNAYLAREFPRLDFIRSARIVE